MNAEDIRQISIRGKHAKIDAETEKRRKILEHKKQLRKMPEYLNGVRAAESLLAGVFESLEYAAKNGLFSCNPQIQVHAEPPSKSDFAWVLGAADEVTHILRARDFIVEPGPLQTSHDGCNPNSAYVPLNVRW